MAEELCPTCHSRIGAQSTVESERAQGKEGTDENENPVPRWTDDPIFTPRGFSGDTYKDRHNNIKTSHIVELQDARKEQEEEAGIPDALRTNFSDITEETRITQRHIIELRESTEKVLNIVGLTLEDYFKFDDNEEEQPQNPKIVGAGGDDPQTEWVDVERGATYFDGTGAEKSSFELPDGTIQDSPTLPARHPIRAIHIEDLRHPLAAGVADAIVIARSNQAFSARLDSETAFFKQATPCGIEEP